MGRFLMLACMGGCLTICQIYWISQQLFSVPPHDWANSGSADVFLAVVSMVLVLWEFVLFYGMGVEFKGEIYRITPREEMTEGCHCRKWTFYV